MNLPPHPLFRLMLFLSLVGCSDRHANTDTSHGHAHDGSGHAPHGPHGSEKPSEVVTLWGDYTQLFVEFPAMVVGEESPFAAHLTRLNDHLALKEGTVTVELSGGGHPTESFMVDTPARVGLFRPVVTPVHPGTRKVTLKLESSAATETHDMGTFVVSASQHDAHHTLKTQAPSGDQITYLLEQQWNVPFRIEPTLKRSMRPNIPAFAKLAHPAQATTLITAPRSGRVASREGAFPRVGASIQKGASLFQLTTTPQGDGDLATLDLATEQAQIRVNSAKREVERLTPLVKQGVVAQRRLDAAQSTLATARAELKSAQRRKRSLTQAQRVGNARDAFQVPAPIEGAVSEIFISPGAWVSEGDPLARIVNQETLILSVNVPQAYIHRLGEVSGAWFEVEGSGRVITVPHKALVSVGAQVDAETRTLPIRFRINNTQKELFAGTMTLAHLITDKPKLAMAVPVTSVTEDQGADVVYVQTGGESFERRPVQLGVRDGAFVEILSGVEPGEWVVTQGAYAVKLASTSTESIGHGHAH